ncbi:MAG: hypothetical protein K2H74_05265 [Paramuribaculum sp.]|nr:hypothetical protein [Paramuribaculum sp.]
MASTKFPYIQVAVTVVDEEGVPTDFSFNDAPMVTLPALSRIAEMFTDLKDGYLMWEAPGKRAYTYFRLASDEATELSVTMMIDSDVLTSGRPIVSLLGDIPRRISAGETIDEHLMDTLIDDAGFSEEPLRAHADDTAWMEGDDICYRTFASSGELNNIFGFPYQEAYKDYRGVLVVAADFTAGADNELPEITAPVDKALMVVCPPDVTASEYRVSFSDHLTINYYCDGFDPVSVMFEVGTTNRYVRINGPALVVNSAYHAGIIFHRRIPYTVEAVGGTPLDTYTILINGRTANRNDEGFEVANTDFANGPAKITISSTNYSSFSQEFTPDALEAAAPLNVVLQPDSREVLLRLDFGSGRVLEKKLNFEKNAPEYCRLRAGNFHGFRAHRLMGTAVETYNIDVKMTPAKTTPRDVAAPAVTTPPATRTPDSDTQEQPEENISQPQLPLDEPNTPVAPKIDIAPSAIWKPKKSDVVTPNFTNEADKAANTVETESNSVPLMAKMRGYITEKSILVAVTVIVGIAAIWFLVSLISGAGEEAEEETADSTEMVIDSAKAKGVAAPANHISPDEQTDIAYLNSNSKWRASDLKSETYRSLITAMAKGDIDAMARNPYFSIKGRCSNKDANTMMDYLWKAKGSFTEKRNKQRLKELSANNEVDLKMLNSKLALCRPKEPNETPRPITEQ